MKLGSIAAMAVALGMLGGCQSITYQKADAPAQQVQADTKACQDYQLRRWIAMGGNYVENMDRDEFEKPCMEARGYRQVMVPSRS